MANATDSNEKERLQKTARTSDVLLLRCIRIDSTIVQQDKGIKVRKEEGKSLVNWQSAARPTHILKDH